MLHYMVTRVRVRLKSNASMKCSIWDVLLKINIPQNTWFDITEYMGGKDWKEGRLMAFGLPDTYRIVKPRKVPQLSAEERKS